MVKLISSIIALALAFVFTYFAPNSNVEQVLIVVLSAVGSYLGINWRMLYTDVKNWLASKTILGAVIFGISAVLLAVTNLSLVNLPLEIKDLLYYIVSGSGGLFLIGVGDAIRKNSK